ncbi:acetyl-CoA C-acetyltransferase [Emcibacter sp. SYSU 3D8]|uniref:acetyl-CoA C-acetyltransferase n=1 Tax=Emcibacter sp. SYSU 3D8 TaxID=3133969 RepID=UPI0031FEEC5D
MRVGRPVYIVDGARTPFLKARGKPGPFTPVDLAVQCGRPLLDRQDMPRTAFDRVILGCVNVVADEMNPARVAALRLGMGTETVAYTVQINCGSGMQSIDNAFRSIQAGDAELVLAGGAEALSHAPLVFQQDAAAWFGGLMSARGLAARVRALAGFRPRFLKPVIGLERGLTDPVVELNMGQTAEIIAHLFRVSRESSDAYAAESHHRLAHAQNSGWLEDEVEPAMTRAGAVFEADDGVRPDSTPEQLAALRPVFEPPYGKITAGNASQITDGASWVILASEEALEKHRLKPRAVILDSQWSALDPSIMGLAPTLCATDLLKRRGMSMADVDLWELNEAFAAQVLSCLAAWNDADYCQNVLGLDGPLGRIERDRLNPDGGAISMGHPVGASGNRIVLHLVNALHRMDLHRGIATECIGGGQGGAMLIERI